MHIARPKAQRAYKFMDRVVRRQDMDQGEMKIFMRRYDMWLCVWYINWSWICTSKEKNQLTYL